MIGGLDADFIGVKAIAVIFFGYKASKEFVEDEDKAANLFLAES